MECDRSLRMNWFGGNGFKVACGVLIAMSIQGPALAQAPATPPAQPACMPLADTEVPVGSLVRAKVLGMLDSGHLKPGKGFWVTAERGVIYPGCTIEAEGPIYGTVTSSSKQPGELSVVFDHADCSGQGKRPIKFFLIGVEGPAEAGRRMHDAVPTEVHGSRDIRETVAGTTGHDAKVSENTAAAGMKPGTVRWLNTLTLDPQGGPACSARLASSQGSVQLPPGTILLLGLAQ